MILIENNTVILSGNFFTICCSYKISNKIYSLKLNFFNWKLEYHLILINDFKLHSLNRIHELLVFDYLIVHNELLKIGVDTFIIYPNLSGINLKYYSIDVAHWFNCIKRNTREYKNFSKILSVSFIYCIIPKFQIQQI